MWSSSAAFFGGVGVLVAPTAQESSTAGGVGFFGIVISLLSIAWWVWGMVDVKRLCETFQRGGTR